MQEKLDLLDRKNSDSDEEFKKIERELRIAEASTKDPESMKELWKEEKNDLQIKLTQLESKIGIVQSKLDSFNKEEQTKKDELLKQQGEIQELQIKINKISNEINNDNIEIAKIETKQEDLEREINENLGLDELRIIKENKIATDPEIKKIIPSEREEKIKRLKNQLDLIGGIDPAIQEEYQATSERYNFLTSQINDLEAATCSLEKIIEELEEKIKKQFREAFNKINHEFSKYFKLLFDGGKASLTLRKEELVLPQEKEELEEREEQSLEPTEEGTTKPQMTKKEKVVTGIDIQACPPGKKLSDLNMLSGGEKALTSIALIYAIIANNPPPFVILDEVDAALDEANSIKYAKILEHLAHKTQFVTITHNRATMHQSAILYGVTMQEEGISKLLSVKMEEVDKMRELTKNSF